MIFGESRKVSRLKSDIKIQRGALQTYEYFCSDAISYIEEKGLQNEEHFKVPYAKLRAANHNYNTHCKDYISHND